MGESAIHIGASGWHYSHWVGPVYPHGTRPAAFLPFYTQHFQTVELNNSFYRLPARATFARWRERTPPGFCFAVKASRYLTHMKKLKEPEEPIRRFLDAADGLGEKLGPILFQLPPHWRLDLGRFAAFLDALPPERRYAAEFREPSWFDDRVAALLEQHNVAFCIWNMGTFNTPQWITAGFVYVRLHGPGGGYSGSYDEGDLSLLADWIAGWHAGGREVFCYFNNDNYGHAVHNALRVRQLLRERTAAPIF